MTAAPRGVDQVEALIGGGNQGKVLGVEKGHAIGKGGVGEGDSFDGGLAALLAFEPISVGLEESGSMVGEMIPLLFWGAFDARGGVVVFSQGRTGDSEFAHR